jgi:hypothetical protein
VSPEEIDVQHPEFSQCVSSGSGGITAGGSPVSGSTLSGSASGNSAVLPGASGGSAALVVHSQRSAGSVGVDSPLTSSSVLWGVSFVVQPALPPKVTPGKVTTQHDDCSYNR